ncbi:MAG: hypothetical protein K1X94_28435 [Sandaracinaceae bacterium]|nr:hypothetical protein [Sandaracinaceae bacterium]
MATKKARPAILSLPLPQLAAQLGVSLDERGYLPLERARAIVKSSTRFTRDGEPPAEPRGDVLWAALLSLEDGPELAREGARLEWAFPFLRGWNNEDAVIRYGDDALPWLEAMLDAHGPSVASMPMGPFYFVGTHLLAIGPDAARAVLRVERDPEPDPDGLGFVSEWLARHGAPAWKALGSLARAGDTSAKRAISALAKRSPSQVRRQLGAALAKELLDTNGDAVGTAKTALEASSILAVLDAAARTPISDRLPWPTLVARAGHFEVHAMRVIAARAKKGDDWGILVEVVQGDILGSEDDVRWPATIQRYTYGSKVASGGRYLEDVRRLPPSLRDAAPDAARCEALDLRPMRSITGMVSDWPSVLALRALVADAPETLFPPAAGMLGALGLAGAEVLLDVRRFEHVDGTAHGRGPLKRLPSQSASWRSIADVIAARDPARFDPGAPNTDWRLHAQKTQER